MPNWKTKTCEDCGFRIGIRCLKFPPSIKQSESYSINQYPIILEFIGEILNYSHACSEYKEENEHLKLQKSP